MGMMGGNWGSFGYMGLFGLLFNIVILVGIVWLVIWAVKQFTGSNNTSSHTLPPPNGYPAGQSQSAREILDIRYAKGELTREEYQTMIEDLL